MQKIWLFFVLLTVVAASACAPVTDSAGQPAGSSTSEPAETALPTIDLSLPPMECQVVSVSPTPGPTEVSLFPPVQEDDWVMGGENATLTITEYSDFQCPYCSLLASDLKQLYDEHPEDVRIVFRHFPLPGHPLAMMAAYATEAAGEQDMFWEMHDLIFSQQQSFASMSEDQFAEWLVEQAADLGLDETQFGETMNSQAVTEKVKSAQHHGLTIGIPGTPFLLLNGLPYQGPRDLANLKSILKLMELEDQQFTLCPPMLLDPDKEYTALIKTEKGDVLLQLYPDKAPLTVNSFVFLARQGWFNDITFHRVLPGFMAQTGDPSGTGFGGPGYFFKNEISDLKYAKAGMVGMANSGPDSNGSQFFLTYQATPNLDGGYTIFGEVIEGMDVLEQISPRDPSQQMDLPQGDKIISIEIQEK